MRALIYDDDEELAQECAEALAQRGYETRTRRGETDFPALIAEFAPDLIMLDVHMPEFNGIEALLVLAEAPRKPVISVIMMSGARDGLLDAGLSLGRAHGVRLLGMLDKPFSFRELDRLLADVPKAPPLSAAR
ncbi:MAG: response regulator transcription factor [Parvibaculaceae bacterium]|nr:response regulator transcription factor [Parvibaculaceae bacterium]